MGFTTTTIETVATVWAYFRHLSGKEDVLFQIGYRTDITPAHMIRYNGVDYEITRIDTFEGYKTDLTVYCKRK